jgi:hypothetical protein
MGYLYLWLKWGKVSDINIKLSIEDAVAGMKQLLL